MLAALAQGFIVGALVSGLKIEGRVFAGGVWDWLNPLAALVALGVLCAYLLLGATYLILKTEGEVREKAYRQAQVAAWSLLIVSAGLGLLGPLQVSLPGPPVVCLADLVAHHFSHYSGRPLLCHAPRQPAEVQRSGPLCLEPGHLFFSFLAMAASLYPYVIPPAITVAEAAAPPLILAIMLAVTAVILPVMLIYNGYQYLVFRGKAGGGGYGE